MDDYIKSFFPETQPIKTPTDYEIVRLVIENVLTEDKQFIKQSDSTEYKKLITWAEDLGITIPPFDSSFKFNQ